MNIIGFNFTKISIEKIKDKAENPKIKTDISILEIKKAKPGILKTKEEILEAEFSYDVDYEPGYANVGFAGKVFLSVEPKVAKEVLKQWKEKKMPEDFKFLLFNIILRKSTLRALNLEDELNLPLHLPLPSIKKRKEE